MLLMWWPSVVVTSAILQPRAPPLAAWSRPALIPPPRIGAHAGQRDAHAISLTKRWIEEVVVRLGLCPYAAKPFVAEEIRYVVSDATDDESLVNDFFVEAALLLDLPEDELATSFLIAPDYDQGIEEFYGLYEWLADTLEEAPEQPEASDTLEALVGDRVQPAFFHPQWSFSGLPEQDPTHFEKRSPLPVINLLRRASLNRVVEQGLAKGIIVNKEIAEHNEHALRREGYAALEACFARLHEPRPLADEGEAAEDHEDR